MPRSARNDVWWLRAIPLILLLAALGSSRGAQVILHLKNGDRLTGTVISETTNSVTLASPLFGNASVPLAEISRREVLPENGKGTTAAPVISGGSSTNNPELKPGSAKKPPLSPANPEATPIAATPH